MAQGEPTSSVQGELTSTTQGELPLPTTETIRTAEPIPTVQESYVGCSYIEGELPSTSRPEESSDIVDIHSTTSAGHQKSCLHILTKDHPPGQIIGKPSSGIQTRSSTDLNNQYHFVTFMSSVEPKTTKEALMEPNWIIAIQEELDEFKQNKV